MEHFKFSIWEGSMTFLSSSKSYKFSLNFHKLIAFSFFMNRSSYLFAIALNSSAYCSLAGVAYLSTLISLAYMLWSFNVKELSRID